MKHISFETQGDRSDAYEQITTSIRSASSALGDLGLPVEVDWRAAFFGRRNLADAMAVLANDSIVFVDDQRVCLSAYALPLQLVCGGKAGLVLSGDRSVAEVVEEVVGLKPTLVLVDYFFSIGASGETRSAAEQFTGADVVRMLLRQPALAQTLLIGFSADSMFHEFAVAGAHGAVTKLDAVEPAIAERLGFEPPEQALLEVARIVNKLRAPSA
jgi:hypothetical protein